MRRFLFLLFVCVSPFIIFAQQPENLSKNFISSEYNRNTVTLVGLDFSENLSQQVMTNFSKLTVPDKFYDNPLQNKVVTAGVARSEVSNLLSQIDDEEIISWLNRDKVGQQILSTWFNRQSDGSFNVEVLQERGLFNANDNDFIVASASKRGESSLMDMGLQLVNQSYVIVFDFANIMSMNQFYEQNEIETDKRVMNGYRATMRSYLYKLNYNDSVAAVFFQDYWTTSDDQNRAAKITAFENAKFPFIPISKQYGELLSTQYNPGHSLAPETQKTPEELLDQLTQMALEKAINDIERQNADFRVKAMVSDVKPIAAKIGKKEGLKFDQRYFVYENRTRRNGNVFSKRIGVVKSMKVVDNRNVTTGQTDPSLFYQIAGGSVDNYGMFLEQHNDAGLNIFVGATAGGFTGATGRLEYYISKVLYDIVAPGSLAKGLTSLKIYVEGGYGLDTYSINEYVEDFTFTRVSFGLNKDIYLLNFLHWGPFIGYGLESATWESSENKISSDFIELGARIGINLSHNIQLIGSGNYNLLISSEELDSNNDVVSEDFDYKATFEDRMGVSASVGLRIMF